MGWVRAVFLNNLPYKLLSVLLALGLWTIVRGAPVDGEIAIPLEVVVPEGLVMVSDPPRRLAVSVHGSRTALQRMRRTEVAPLRLAPGVSEPGTVQISILPEDLNLPVPVSVSRVSPSRFEVLLERRAVRRVPVHVRLVGQVPEAFVAGSPMVEPATVQVAGAASLIRSLEAVYTQPISIEGRSGDFTERSLVSLPHPQLWVEGEETVAVTIPVTEIDPQESPEPSSEPESQR